MSMNSKYKRLEGIEDNLLLPHDVNENNGKETSFQKFKKYIIKKWKILLLLVFVILLVCGVILIPIIVQRYKTSVISHQCETYGKQIVESSLKGTSAYQRLTTFTTLFPGRLSGSNILEEAIDWAYELMNQDGFDLVHTDDVSVTNWVRGNESAYIVEPYQRKMNIAGLGGSVGTGGKVLVAPVLVVSSFDELDSLKDQVPGKIVLFNAVFTNYSSTVQYRSRGASAAAQYGGVAALVRSVTPYSLGSPHTGVMWYSSSTNQIPTASVTLEDADLIQNLVNLNQSVSVSLYMEAQTLPMATSRNVMAQINGTDYPDQVVVIGGHVDCWDIAQGAQDDGGGFLVAWEALRLIKNLGIKPKRTIRAVGWTNEENGAAGGQDYANRYTEETFFSIESDIGVTSPVGFNVNASSKTIKSLQLIANKVLAPIKSDIQIVSGEVGTDNGFLVDNGKPGAQLITDESRYFWYHHTAGDAIDKVDPSEIDQCVGTMASMALCIANWAGETIN